jgi:hypothetical protein
LSHLPEQPATREPGEDDDTFGNPIAKKVKKHQEGLSKLVDVIKTKHNGTLYSWGRVVLRPGLLPFDSLHFA